MPMISYAQNREDVLLARVFRDVTDGFYVDVGANHPLCCSVTKHFYELGWRGVNVEPNTKFDLLAADRTRDANLNLAVGDHDGTVTFYEFPGSIALSTAAREEAEEHREKLGLEFVERRIPLRSLASVCEEHVDRPIDFMSIDVEGFERQVIAGGDWTRWRPRVVLIEATRPNLPEPTHDEWEPLLLARGYVFVYFDGLNRFYVRQEDESLAEHFHVPVNVFDGYILYEHIEQIIALRQEHEQATFDLERKAEQQAAVIAQLRARMDEIGVTDRLPIAVARRVQRCVDRFPGTYEFFKRIRRRVRGYGPPASAEILEAKPSARQAEPHVDEEAEKEEQRRAA